MQITDLLAQAGGLSALSQRLGIDEQQAYRGADALMPALLGGFKKQAQAQPAGLAGLASLFQQLGGERMLNEAMKAQAADAAPGNDILGQLFGSKEVSRNVAQNASAQSGLDQGTLQKMLPMLAMLLTGYLSRQQAGSATAAPANGLGSLGNLGNLAGQLLGGLGGQNARARTGNNGNNGLLALLDMNGDGNVLDDIMRMASRMRR